MNESYVATFHTFYGAQCFYRRLVTQGDGLAKMLPVPRSLSVSCGTGVSFSLPFDQASMPDEDTDSVYLAHDGRYECIYSSD